MKELKVGDLVRSRVSFSNIGIGEIVRVLDITGTEMGLVNIAVGKLQYSISTANRYFLSSNEYTNDVSSLERILYG